MEPASPVPASPLPEASFPFQRESFSVFDVLAYAWQQFTRDWLMVTVAALAFFAVVLGAEFLVGAVSGIVDLVAGVSLEPGKLTGPAGPIAAALGVRVVVTIFAMLVNGVMQLGFNRILVDVLHGRPVNMSLLFSQLHKTGKVALFVALMFGMVFVLLIPLIAFGVFAGLWHHTEPSPATIALAVLFFIALLLVLGFFVFIPVSLFHWELALQDDLSAVEALGNCFVLASGHRWRLLGAILLGMVFMMAGVLLCCLPALPAFALAQMLLGAVYLALRNSPSLRLAPERPSAPMA